MAEEEEIKIFRASEIRDWLWHNQKLEGYSNRILSPVRANAILHNPYVEDNDPIAAAVYVGDRLAAYTAAFPDRINGQKVWWFSTLWCHKDFRGKGYSLIAVGSLAEEYGEGNYFDMWGAQETVEIFKFLGSQTTYLDEYVFEQKNIVQDSFKGRMMFRYESWKTERRIRRSGMMKKVQGIQYRLMYTDFIDDRTYALMQAHSENDLWFREQEMMNWILAYPFKHCSPLYRRDYNTGYFAGKNMRYWKSGVKVYVEGHVVGYYHICDSDKELSVKYLYYQEQYEEQVFASIAEHILNQRNRKFSTRNPRLADYIRRSTLFKKHVVEKVSFSYPETYNIAPNAISQGGDGDGFVG